MDPHRQMLLWAALISVTVHVMIGLLLASVRAGAPPPALVERSVLVDVVEQDEAGGAGELVPLAPTPAAAFPVQAVEQPLPSAQPQETSEPETTRASPSLAANSRPGAASESAVGGSASGGSFFGITPRGQRIVYVLDRSSSMGRGGALEVANREVLASLRSLPPQASFQIIIYHSVAQFLLPQHTGWLTAAQLPQVEAALLALVPEGGTRHQLALPLALSLQPDVIFFLTDADDLPAAHVAEVTTRNQGRAIIHTVELTHRHLLQPDMPLQRLARQNRGDYRAVAVGP